MENKSDNKGNYKTFFLMLGSSFIAMYVTMYFHTYEWDHVYFSWTRLYMTFLGISAMAVIMLYFMRHMYKDKKKNMAIYIGSALTMILFTTLVRTQTPLGDKAWMEAMIPHHSIAILTSSRADIDDPEAKKLAEEIIEAQAREIAQMKKILYRLEHGEEAED